MTSWGLLWFTLTCNGDRACFDRHHHLYPGMHLPFWLHIDLSGKTNWNPCCKRHKKLLGSVGSGSPNVAKLLQSSWWTRPTDTQKQGFLLTEVLFCAGCWQWGELCHCTTLGTVCHISVTLTTWVTLYWPWVNLYLILSRKSKKLWGNSKLFWIPIIQVHLKQGRLSSFLSRL